MECYAVRLFDSSMCYFCHPFECMIYLSTRAMVYTKNQIQSTLSPSSFLIQLLNRIERFATISNYIKFKSVFTVTVRDSDVCAFVFFFSVYNSCTPNALWSTIQDSTIYYAFYQLVMKL